MEFSEQKHTPSAEELDPSDSEADVEYGSQGDIDQLVRFWQNMPEDSDGGHEKADIAALIERKKADLEKKQSGNK